MKPLVSVIVPVYKVEDYLGRCIDSILCQSYPSLEIILVDDGSPDRCGAICDEYAKKDNRIRVIHKPNGGLSDARNAGLAVATGEFLFFVDSDDWIAPDAIESLAFQLCENIDVDLVAGSTADVQQDEMGILETRHSIELGTLQKLNSLEAMRNNLLNGWAAWNKLYRRSLFQSIRFPKGRINEDEAIMLRLLSECRYAILLGKTTYYYFLRQNSITTSSFSEKKMDWFDNCLDNYQFVLQEYPQLGEEALFRLETALLYLLQFMLLNPSRYTHCIAQLRHCLGRYFKPMINNRYNTRAHRLRLRLFRLILKYRLSGIYRFGYQTYSKIRRR